MQPRQKLQMLPLLRLLRLRLLTPGALNEHKMRFMPDACLPYICPRTGGTIYVHVFMPACFAGG